MIKKIICIFLLTLSFFLSGCKNDEDRETASEIDQLSESIEAVQIINPWIRPAAKGMNTAVFFNIVNNTDASDTLFNAESELAEITEIHETYMLEKDKMGMRHKEFIEILSHSTIEFKPRDLLVMLMKLKNDLKIGESGEVVLQFQKAGNIKITAEVKDLMPMK